MRRVGAGQSAEQDGTEMAERKSIPEKPGVDDQVEDGSPLAASGPVARVWAFRVSVTLFSLWLAWLAFLALGRLSV
ncbi:MAG: hypothetical protein MK108_14545 [Mariniblastus sp.]|nr:hypothetical protein [Mariniblastus sp.]